MASVTHSSHTYSAYLNVVEYVREDLLLRNSEVWVVIFWMRAHVDHTIHVQIQVVKLWDLREDSTPR